MLTVTRNKVQLITIICKQLVENVQMLQLITDERIEHSLIHTASNPVPLEIKRGIVMQRDNMKTTHEEADVILPQQMVSAASNNQCTKVLPDDTNVFVLMANHYMMKGLKLQGFDRGD